ncbi:MAG TPA: hypothetical protein ENO22_06570 [candidate division Zixibacteria bacterium]|nr:hypothetical protein [candidate division Zixibacteria bacterium]
MAKEKTKKKKEETEENLEESKPLDETTRFRYIGFDVFGKKSKDFFKSEEEQKEYEKSVEQYRSGHISTFREFTAVNQDVLPMLDKIVLTISSLVLVISGFLPWLRFESNWTSMSFRGLTGYFQVSQFSDVISLFNPNLMIYVYIPTLMAVLAFIFGIITLVFLWLPAKTFEAYLKRLKRFMSLGWYVLAVWLAFFIVSVVGISLPFGEWMAENYGVRGVGSSVNIVSFATLSGLGVWMSIAAFILNSVKANDL